MGGAPRLFTVPEAEATLPLVRRIVGDLLQTYPRWREAVTIYEVLTGAAHDSETPELRAARAEQENALQISGAFSIEGEGGKFVEKIEGDYNNVIGLPLIQLREMLEKLGVKLPN